MNGQTEIDAPVIGFPKFFTPNNDTYNDTWKVIGAHSIYFKSVAVTIFDRFGKILVILDLNSNSFGWDGIYSGKTMPKSDYWFSAALVDKKGKTRIRRGHFSLLR
ncbi:MAG TPA: T9SS type B sorting domain-containing protein [Lutibacter sp.]|nr:T9SS type B sorting domain-containing protein [Lutibacter sp.]